MLSYTMDYALVQVSALIVYQYSFTVVLCKDSIALKAKKKGKRLYSSMIVNKYLFPTQFEGIDPLKSILNLSKG